MLRHYDRIGLVSPSGRSPNGYRDYSENDLRQLFRVEALRSLGMPLRLIAETLSDSPAGPERIVEELIDQTRRRRAREDELLRRLEQVRMGAPSGWDEALRIVGLLRGLDSAEASVRQRFVLSLRADADAEVLAETALTEPDPNVRGALNWAIAREGDRAVPVLDAALRSSSPERRRRAAEALEKIGSAQAAAALAGAWESEDPLIRARAVLARGRRGTADAIPALVDLVVDGPHDVEAAEALGALAEDRALRGCIVSELRSRCRAAAGPTLLRIASALAEVPGGEAASALSALALDPDRLVAATAAHLAREHGAGPS